jgi:hypothetical protein
MQGIVKKIGYFQRLSLREQTWFMLSFALLGINRALVLMLPLQKYQRYLGRHYQTLAVSLCLDPSMLLKSQKIGRMIQLAAKYTPWNSNCMAQALTAKLLLSYYRLPYLLYFGLKKGDSANLEAHAWVCVGKTHVTGGWSFGDFAIVSTYGPKNLEFMPSLIENTP